eukprot:4426752-Amphidinium_carterae.1
MLNNGAWFKMQYANGSAAIDSQKYRVCAIEQKTMHTLSMLMTMMIVTVSRAMLTMLKLILPNRLLDFHMVAELARSIVNHASQLWETIALMQ